MKTLYELKRIKNSADRNLTQALVIYARNIESILRTDTREIIYWLDNYNKAFNDKFFLLCLLQNEVVIGFAQLAYFVEEKIVFVDYIVIDEEHRKNNTFYELIDNIKEFLYEEGLQYDYIVGEVGYFNDDKQPTATTRTLIRLLKMSGFGVVKTNYYQPMLGKSNYESELQSILMLFTPNDLKKIKKETFTLIIETIYYKHYKRWFDKFFTEKEQSIYNLRLIQLFEKIESEIKKKDFIEINGYSNLFPVTNKGENDRMYIRVAKFIGLVIVFLSISAIMAFCVVLLKRKFDLDSHALTFISVAAVIVILLFSKIFYKSSTNDTLTESIEKVIRTFK